MKIYAIFSIMGHTDCLILLSAENAEDAVRIADEKTTIFDENFCEDNIRAREMNGLFSNKEYIHIFADDIEYRN